LAMGDPFLKAVLREGKVLHGRCEHRA
jgi:hypothetical protein